MDRTGACIIGASLMVAFGVLDFRQAYAAIDDDTIILLFGVMIVVANVRLSGFFGAVAEFVVEHAHRPILLLAAICVRGRFPFRFFRQRHHVPGPDALVLEITRELRRNPVPYLLAVAMAANVGSVATITGNPQNMMIASCAAVLSPVAAAGLVLTVAVIAPPTILGSVANLIVIQKSRHATKIGSWEYFRVGGPLTILTIALGLLILR